MRRGMAWLAVPLTPLALSFGHTAAQPALAAGLYISNSYEVGTFPVGLDLDTYSGHTYLYVANHGSDTVQVIDVADTNASLVGTTIATIPVGTGPAGLIVNPVDHHVFVGSDSDVTVIDGTLSPPAVLTTVTSNMAASPNLFAVDPNPGTNRIFVSDVGCDEFTVINPATFATQAVKLIPGQVATGIAFSPARQQLWLTTQQGALLSYSTANNVYKPVTGQPQPPSGSSLAGVSVDAQFLFVPTQYGVWTEDLSGTDSRLIPTTYQHTPGAEYAVANADGTAVEVLNTGANSIGFVSLVDPTSGQINLAAAALEEVLPLPQNANPIFGVDVPGYVSLSGINAVVRIGVDSQPPGLTVDPLPQASGIGGNLFAEPPAVGTGPVPQGYNVLSGDATSDLSGINFVQVTFSLTAPQESVVPTPSPPQISPPALLPSPSPSASPSPSPTPLVNPQCVPEACYTTHATLNCPANLLSCHWRVQLPRLTPPTGSSTPGGSPYIPGQYVATIVAVDYAQQSSAAQYVYFTVI